SQNNQNIYTGSSCEPTYTNLAQLGGEIYSTTIEPDFGCNATATPSLIVKNMGQDTITSMVIGYKSGTNAQQTYNYTGSIPTFKNSAEIVLPQLDVVIGTSTPIELEILSINGVAQTGLTYVKNILKPTLPDAVEKAKLRLYIDRYGSEITWNVKNSSGTIVANGGPYTDGTASGTRLIEAEFNLDAIGCYTFEIKDSYGDGINAGYGAGSYSIIDNDSTILAYSNGSFNSGEKKDIKLASVIGLNDVENNISSINVYPNPIKDIATLDITLSENSTATIQVIDMLGRNVIDLGSKSMKTGENTIEFNTSKLNNGMYFIKVITDNGIVSKKVTVSK
ncbi:MAG: T9SS type A sorting domain-containing protein, partial [Bacteroidales bacterium]|nr:T9SS type A sorting domain-containing protein [Bacteroidales bacterium]